MDTISLACSLHVIYTALERFCICSFSRNLSGPLNRKQKLKIPRHVCYKRNCSVKRLVTRQRYKWPPNRLSTLGPRELLVPGFRHKMVLCSRLPNLQLCTYLQAFDLEQVQSSPGTYKNRVHTGTRCRPLKNSNLGLGT